MAGVVPDFPRIKFTGPSGSPLASGTVTVYLAGTTELANTWQDEDLTTLNTNPVVLDANGEALIYVDPSIAYKFVLANAAGAVQWTQDHIIGEGSSLSIPFKAGGTGAASRTAQDKLRERVSPEDFGARGDGVSDDAPAFRLAVAAAKFVHLTSGASYLIRSRIDMPSGVTLMGASGAEVVMDTSAGGFDSTGAYAGATNQVGFLFDGSTGGGIEGVKIRLNTRSDNLCACAIVVRSSTAVRIAGNDLSNFAKTKVVRIETSSRVEVVSNYIHDCSTNSATTGQLTGIDIDDNRVAGNSSGCLIAGNRIVNLTVGAAFLASFGYQTDGINVSHEDSRGHVIADNYISNVGEGIDCFGADCVIKGNVVRDPYNVGIKLVHGARRNVVEGNNIASPGLGGIVLGGNAADANNTEHNVITGNQISGVNTAGNWSAANTYGIKLEDDNGGVPTRRCANNRISGNSVVRCTSMKYGVLVDNDSEGNLIERNYIDAPTIAEVTFSAAALAQNTFLSGKPTAVRAQGNAFQSIPASTETVVNFPTVTVNRQGEFTGGNLYTASTTRRLQVSVQVRTGAATAGKEYDLRLLKNGSIVARANSIANATTFTLSLTDLVPVAKGDTLRVALFHNEAAAITVTPNEYTRLSIVEAA